jgi:predicted O-methyltransferase YrrM
MVETSLTRPIKTRAKERATAAATRFQKLFAENLRRCKWRPHPRYNVFTQYDGDWYVSQKEAFIEKYRCFYAVSKTISPRSIIELGVLAGSSADAYLSATPDAKYIGIDTFTEFDAEKNHSRRKTVNKTWKPLEIAERLFEERGFKHTKLIRADLRRLKKLPRNADLVVVDAAHDFENEYADLKLAMTASPSFIFVDDADDPRGAKPAIEKFLAKDLAGQVEFTFHVDYVGGGLVIKLK